ncbi:MAG: response regulator transcription factor [Anaerolineae bacterium]
MLTDTGPSVVGTGARILVVEDEISLLETLEYNLRREGYDVVTAADGRDAMQAAREKRPDLILLDIMLPGLDGLEVCRRLRKEMATPVIMLTARADEIDKVVGLEVGADDYMTKPFGMRELLARVRALLRRSRLNEESLEDGSQASAGKSDKSSRYTFGNLTLDAIRHQAFLSQKPLELKPKEYDLLLFLIQHRGMVVSRDLILERVWGWTYGGGTRTVDVHIRWLREKIEDDPSAPARIITVRGVGYRFEG